MIVRRTGANRLQDPVQRGRVCTDGTTCAAPGGGGDTRNLLDRFNRLPAPRCSREHLQAMQDATLSVYDELRDDPIVLGPR